MLVILPDEGQFEAVEEMLVWLKMQTLPWLLPSFEIPSKQTGKWA
jgi:hypothetical protein